MEKPKVVTHEEWLAARVKFLEREKEFTRLRDELSRERRELPWEKVGKEYFFDGPNGRQSLAELFGECSQLIVYHFMYGPEWKEGCPSCSFWADNFNGIDVHLRNRDISFLAVSRAPLETLERYGRRMGWSFRWVSSLGSDFNHDFGVTFTPEEVKKGEMDYNYRIGKFPSEEAPGVSVFFKDGDGTLYHTYSCYARGLDMLNGAYHYMDLAPKGRDEDSFPHPMSWVRRRDQYDDRG